MRKLSGVTEMFCILNHVLVCWLHGYIHTHTHTHIYIYALNILYIYIKYEILFH